MEENEKRDPIVESDPQAYLDGMSGLFVDNLKRNSGKIKADRAAAIAELAEMRYKRKIEDAELRLKQMRRDQHAMLDLSPTDTHSLILASDFDGDKFVDKDVDLTWRIDVLQRKVALWRKRYNLLFTKNTGA